LYTLVVRPNGSFEVFIDMKSEMKGTLTEALTPPINPPEEIDDPTDLKPEDWVDEKKIKDPDATKPDDWDEDAPKTVRTESSCSRLLHSLHSYDVQIKNKILVSYIEAYPR
jgi:hypothetical protein